MIIDAFSLYVVIFEALIGSRRVTEASESSALRPGIEKRSLTRADPLILEFLLLLALFTLSRVIEAIF